MEVLALTTILQLSLVLIRFCLLQASKNIYDILHCSQACGGIEVRYPFGLGAGCSLPGFQLSCIEDTLFIADTKDMQVLEILEGEIRMNSIGFTSQHCPFDVSPTGKVITIYFEEDSPYTFSAEANIFVAIGCNTEGFISSYDGNKGFECYATCNELHDLLDFSPNGCCQSSLPPVRKNIEFYVKILRDEEDVSHNMSCSYAFLAEEGRYNFTMSSVPGSRELANISLKLEWAVGESRCEEAIHSENYACKGNSTCVNANRGHGYLCKCLDGYEGNPYHDGIEGCQDVDECNDPSKRVCVLGATCENTIPGYACHCPLGSSGDGLIGRGCNRHLSLILTSTACISITGIMALCFGWCYWKWKRRRVCIKYFHQNGGLLLKKYFNGAPANEIKLFSPTELKKATDNYSTKRILGCGGHGTVYKGILKDGTVIAIKKSQEVAQCEVDQFINELAILTRVKHINIVKLLGCCLETQVPLLVYEFISDGTLHQKLHKSIEVPNQFSWKDRMRIAMEIAEALSYLHSHKIMPIFHRDVKSSNILLDENCTAKLADFGISRLVALDKDPISTTVRGTIGYLDPEYFKTGKLTEKSDVYSYGVVLLELLTCLKPVRHEMDRDYSSLVIHFWSYVGEGNMLGIFDEEILKEVQLDELRVLADIARCCLSINGHERPTMKKVAEELELLRHGQREED